MTGRDFSNITADQLGADALLRGEVRQAAGRGDRDARAVLRQWQQRGQDTGPLAGNSSDAGEGDPAHDTDNGTPDLRGTVTAAFVKAGTDSGVDPDRLAALADHLDPAKLTDDDGNVDPDMVARALAAFAPAPRAIRDVDLGQGQRPLGAAGGTTQAGVSRYDERRGSPSGTWS